MLVDFDFNHVRLLIFYLAFMRHTCSHSSDSATDFLGQLGICLIILFNFIKI